ncbi:MAG: DNA polymerase III subunit gamma/tau [Helicobacteraceae bacterium]|nr:DNA polymerase III subunit gamma/tau [Helicobacteraceae bacterium]
MKESSQVLARKYRPKRFEDLIGQDTITQTLSLALDSNRLSHAYLFSGLRGSGKTSTARIFAKALVCDNSPTSKPCEVCENCVTANESRHIDIIEMDAASSRKIDDIRDLIEATKYKPSIAKFKIFIIDEVHMLTKEAFNALLKTLEEPPEYVKFILATTDPLKLPATILSRTQHFRFKRVSNVNITNHLIHILNLEEVEFDRPALEILSRSGGGSLRDTLTLLDQAIIYSRNHIDVKTVTDMLGLIDPEFITNIFSSIFQRDTTRLIAYVKELEDYEAEMVIDEFIAFLQEKLYESNPTFSILILERFFRILSESKALFAINADGSFVLNLVFFKMMEALKIKEIDQMIESLESQITKTVIKHEMPSPAQIVQDATQEMIKKQSLAQTNDVSSEQVSTPYKEPISVPEPIQTKPNEDLIKFNALIDMISDRSADLGECFKVSIEFVSLIENTLTWESCANEENKAKLRHGYSVIKQFVRELYGFETKIKSQACTKEIVEKKEEVIPQIEPQPASMTEDIETFGGSCVTGCTPDESAPKEFDPSVIMDQPMIKKAIELFEVRDVKVQSKV